MGRRFLVNVPLHTPSMCAKISAAAQRSAIGCSTLAATCKCTAASLDHLVGAGEEGWWHGEAKRLRGLEVDHQLELGWLLDRKFASFLARKNSRDISRSGAIKLKVIGRVAHQTAERRIVAPLVDDGKPKFGRAINNHASLHGRKEWPASYHSALSAYGDGLTHGGARGPW